MYVHEATPLPDRAEESRITIVTLETMASLSTISSARGRVQDGLSHGDRYKTWVLLTALCGMFAATFPVTILAVSLPTIAEDFGTSETLIAWVVSGPMLGSALALPILGKLGDLYGHRRVFLIGFAVSTIVTAATMLAWDPFSLILMRTAAVMIGAATMPSSMALINSVRTPPERARAMGWWSLVVAGAPAIGLVIGGPLIDAFGWRPVFGIQAALSVIPVVASYLVLRETERRDDVGFDLPGALSLAFGIGGIMLAVNQFPEVGASPLVVGSLVAGVVGIVAFALIESRVRHPLLPLEFFRNRNFTFALVASLFTGAAYMGGFILAPLLLQSEFALSVSATSLLMLVRPAAFAVASPFGGTLASRRGERPVALFGGASMAVALIVVGFGAEISSLALVLVALGLQGISNGTSEPPLNAVVANSVEEADLGVAAASQRMAWSVGSALGVTALTSIYGGTERPEDFFLAFGVGAVLALCALVFSAFLRSTTRGQSVTVHVPDPAVPAVAGR